MVQLSAILWICMVAYIASIVIELVLTWQFKRFLLELFAVALVVCLLRIDTLNRKLFENQWEKV